ncbi:TnpV protein [Faecalibacterium prausnitzii]|nr:TnpV protein [Faecalibacterium prausnitzii]
MLAENYGVHSESFGQQLADVAGKLVQSYRDNNSSDILGIVDGSYFLPNLILNQPRKPLGKYGRLRRTYLMNHRPVLYNTMLLNGSLYRKSGYSKKFLEAHREEITLHKAAKAAFDEAGLQKLPKVKELDAEFAELLTKKKAAYPDYRKARDEMQELVRAQKNVELFFAEDKSNLRPQHTR